MDDSSCGSVGPLWGGVEGAAEFCSLGQSFCFCFSIPPKRGTRRSPPGALHLSAYDAGWCGSSQHHPVNVGKEMIVLTLKVCLRDGNSGGLNTHMLA